MRSGSVWFGFSTRNWNRTKPLGFYIKKSKLIRKIAVWFGFRFFFFFFCGLQFSIWVVRFWTPIVFIICYFKICSWTWNTSMFLIQISIVILVRSWFCNWMVGDAEIWSFSWIWITGLLPLILMIRLLINLLRIDCVM